jgi:L-fuconolactonase
MPPSPDRRQFLMRSALASVSAALAASEPAEAAPVPGRQPGERPPKPLRIVDTHQHLWDLKQFRLPWVKNHKPLARNFMLQDHQKATVGLNVVKAVYMEVDVDPKQQVAEAEHILEVCRQGKTTTVAAVISGRPAADDFGKYLARFKGNRFLKGVRQVLHTDATPAGYCLAPNFVRGIRLLGERGLSFDLCMRPGELGDALKLVQACPGTRFILDHCGNPNVQAKDLTPWRRDLERLARCKSLVCKVSGIVVTARARKWTADDLAPVVNHTLDSFGADRVMFGGDWPVCTLRATYRQWVEALKHIVRNRPAADQRKLFHDNAVRFYGLK